MIAKVKELQRKKTATAAAAAAPPAPKEEKKEEEVLTAKDPTEKLLQMLQPDPTRPGVLFPSAVAAHLKKKKLEKQHSKQVFPPKIIS